MWEIVKGSNDFGLIINQGEHEEDKHPEIFKKNKKVREKFDKEYRKINDEKIKNETILFKERKWEGEDMTDEEMRAKGW